MKFPLPIIHLPKRRAAAKVTGAPLYPNVAPAEAVCFLGDIHGRMDLLERFLILRSKHFPDHRLVVLGDMIDRGPDSLAVLQCLHEETQRGAICLLGNHEAMLLDFLASPAPRAAAWLQHGGLETVRSAVHHDICIDIHHLDDIAQSLNEALGDLIPWLRSLPLYWRNGNIVAVHAGMAPRHAPEEQSPHALLWGSENSRDVRREDGLWVAHGHTIVERAFARNGEISLDTGAYATGKLSYALLSPNGDLSGSTYIGITP